MVWQPISRGDCRGHAPGKYRSILRWFAVAV